jgi:hypothetical protein
MYYYVLLQVAANATGDWGLLGFVTWDGCWKKSECKAMGPWGSQDLGSIKSPLTCWILGYPKNDPKWKGWDGWEPMTSPPAVFEAPLGQRVPAFAAVALPCEVLHRQTPGRCGPRDQRYIFCPGTGIIILGRIYNLEEFPNWIRPRFLLYGIRI